MYGTRDAAAAWERDWTKTLNSAGFEFGVSNPALLHSEKMDVFMMAHGDDFITLSDDEALSEVEVSYFGSYDQKSISKQSTLKLP